MGTLAWALVLLKGNGGFISEVVQSAAGDCLLHRQKVWVLLAQLCYAGVAEWML